MHQPGERQALLQEGNTNRTQACRGQQSPTAPSLPSWRLVLKAVTPALLVCVVVVALVSRPRRQRDHGPVASGGVLREQLLDLSEINGDFCQDSPGWTDGNAHCAYEDDGTNAELCRPQAGAFWPITEGWTCKAYEKKGWCEAGLVTEGHFSEPRPEQHCCGCGGGVRRSSSGGPAAPTCLTDTGGTCGFFGRCDGSRGRTDCVGGRCVCQEGHCTDNSGACIAPEVASTTPMASSGVQQALGLETVAGGAVCQSTPGWTDGWTHCAYEADGRKDGLCQPAPGAEWPTVEGWTCEAYRLKGWCSDGKPLENATKGASRSFPERNCCDCGGGRTIASVASAVAAPPPVCEQDTGGTCNLAGCASFRGATDCVGSRCLCQEGYCADSAGTCQPRPSTTALPAVSAVRKAFGLKVSRNGSVCQDTPGWANGWAPCAYQEGGRDSALCRPTPGAFWPSTMGWTCKAYVEQGWCEQGRPPKNPQLLGPAHGYPELHCCACGGGKLLAEKTPSSANRSQALEAPVCFTDTGGSCHFTGTCSEFRGPASCSSGKCVCKPGFCTDATGRCRRDNGVVKADVAPVSAQHPIFPGRQTVRTALCVSGGGSRSMAATLGYLRAMHHLGLMSKVDLISAVSGGTWATAIYMFANMSLDRLLGPRTQPGELTPEALDGPPAPLGGPAAAGTNDLLLGSATAGIPLQSLWVSVVAQAVLRPFGLDDLDSFMAPDAEALEQIRVANPQLRDRHFLVPQPDRPGAFVMSGTVEAPDGYEAESKNVVPLQMAPDFTGSPFYPNDAPVDFRATPGTRRPPLKDVLLGGGMVQSFAFGGAAPSEGQTGGNAVEMQAPLAPLSLARAVGISSAAFGAFASRIGAVGVSAGARCDPQTNLWPVTSARHPGPQAAMTYQLGDGSNLDNTGIIAALQRGAQRIVALINTDTPLDAHADFCGGALEGSDLHGKVTAQLLEKFGHPATGGAFGFFGHNQVFPEQDLQPLLCELSKQKRSGQALVARRKLRVERNAKWGLSGGWTADVAFVLLDRCLDFQRALPAETQRLVAKGLGGFLRYPNFKTVFEGSDLTALSNRQVNLLAAQAEYAVAKNAALLRDLLQ